jgi:hypothetical protein
MPVTARERFCVALTKGVRLPKWGRARVHAKFARAIDLSCAQGVIVLLDAACGLVPHGVRLSGADWPRLHASVRLGDEAALAEGQLRFVRSGLAIDLTVAQTWSARLTRISIDWTQPQVARAFALVRAHMAADTSATARDLASVLFARRIAAVTPALRAAFGRLDAAAACEHLRRLVGLGPGLTPSGDDFIIGCLAGLAVSARGEPARLHCLMQIAQTLALELAATTRISRQHLSDAFELEFAEPLAALAAALANGDRDVMQRLRVALAVGAYSGRDAACGLLLALEAWRPPYPDSAHRAPIALLNAIDPLCAPLQTVLELEP